jgi:hypothetical protein
MIPIQKRRFTKARSFVTLGAFGRAHLGLVSFEPDIVSVQLDGTRLRLEPHQTMIPHGPDRELTVAEARARQ